MALKVLLLRKNRDDLLKEIKANDAKREELQKREAEAKTAIEELTEESTEEEKAAVSEEVDAIESEKEEIENIAADLRASVEKIEREIEALEAKQDEPAEEEKEPEEKEERKEIDVMKTRDNFFGLNRTEQAMFFEREDVKTFMSEIRTAIKEKRTITGAGLLVPDVMIGMIRQNIIEYSKLYKHVNVRQIGGNGREIVMGTIPEAVWEDCCGILNELDLTFNDAEVGCWKVAGYFDICNANLEDTDIALAGEILEALGQAIGYALDKAILFGTGTRMPKGVLTRLVETTAPADYPATARTWTDLHTSNVKSVASSATGIELFRSIVSASAGMKGAYSRGEKTWVMNEATYTKLIAASLEVDGAGAIVSGVNGTMPAIGGAIEVLDFVPDNVIIGGYFDLYLLAERSGITLDQSEHVHFIQDRTVFRGRGRYDGQPVIAEGFIAVGIEGTTPSVSGITFAPDTANADSE